MFTLGTLQKNVFLFFLLSTVSVGLLAQNAWKPSNKIFVAGGNPYMPNLHGEIYISEDGAHTWKKVWSKGDNGYQVKGIASGNGKIVAVTHAAILTSKDAKTWSEVSALPDKIPGAFEDITFADGMFVVVGQSETIMHSADGESWTLVATANFKTEDPAQKEARKKMMERVNVAKLPGGKSNTAPKETVEDLIFGLDTRNHFNAVTYEKGRFILTGSFQRALYLNKEGNGLKITTEDYRNGDIMSKCFGALYAGGKYLLVGDKNYHSSDGKSWTMLPHEFNMLKDVAYGKKNFVAAGSFGSVIISADGATWNKVPVQGAKNLTTYFDVVYGNGRFVIAGQHGAMAISDDDGKTWKNVGTEGQPTQPTYQCLAYVEL